jgi:hypothetical protein
MALRSKEETLAQHGRRKSNVRGVRTASKSLMRALTNDFELCAKRLAAEDTQFMRRTLFRTAFSMFEALNYFVAKKTLEVQVDRWANRRKVDIVLLNLLTGRKHAITDDGEVRGSAARPPFRNFTAFVLKSFAKTAGVRKNYFKGDGWLAFRMALKVRNRITHPQTKKELLISNDDSSALLEGASWYLNSLYDIAKRSKSISIPIVLGLRR